jgi:hypothetical protein
MIAIITILTITFAIPLIAIIIIAIVTITYITVPTITITNIAISIITMVIIIVGLFTVWPRQNTLSYIFNQWEVHTKFQITIIIWTQLSSRYQSLPFQYN